MSDKIKLNELQTVEVGHIVALHWGWHFQTGVDIDEKVPYLYLREGPNTPLHKYFIHPNGQVDKEVLTTKVYPVYCPDGRICMNGEPDYCKGHVCDRIRNE